MREKYQISAREKRESNKSRLRQSCVKIWVSMGKFENRSNKKGPPSGEPYAKEQLSIWQIADRLLLFLGHDMGINLGSRNVLVVQRLLSYTQITCPQCLGRKRMPESVYRPAFDIHSIFFQDFLHLLVTVSQI